MPAHLGDVLRALYAAALIALAVLLAALSVSILSNLWAENRDNSAEAYLLFGGLFGFAALSLLLPALIALQGATAKARAWSAALGLATALVVLVAVT